MMQAVVILQIPDLRNLIRFHSACDGENFILSRVHRKLESEPYLVPSTILSLPWRRGCSYLIPRL